MAIVEGPFQNITQIASGGAFCVSINLSSSSILSDQNFVRFVGGDGSQFDYNLGSSFQFLNKRSQGAEPVPVLGLKCAFPFIAKERNLLTNLYTAGFSVFDGAEGLVSAISYQCFDLKFIGRFPTSKSKFVYLVEGGLDEGIYVGQIQENGTINVTAYVPYIDIQLDESLFNAWDQAVAAEVELPGNPLAVYFSDPGDPEPAIIRFGFRDFIAISGTRVAVTPRVIKIREVGPGGNDRETYITVFVMLDSTLTPTTVTVDPDIPTPDFLPAIQPPISDFVGNIRVDDASSNDQLLLTPTLQYIGPRPRITGQTFTPNTNAYLRLVSETESGSFGFIDVTRRFEFIDFQNNDVYGVTPFYDTLTDSNPIETAIDLDGSGVLFSAAAIFGRTDRATVYAGSFNNGDSFSSRSSLSNRRPINIHYGALL